MSINTRNLDFGSMGEQDRASASREAGHILYGSISGTVTPSGSYQGDTECLSGRPNSNSRGQNKISPVRRTFCLFVLFDLILTFILWVIYTQISGIMPLSKAFITQVGNYTFQHSLFDTVLCAAWRFFPLILAYALFRINNPWVVATTTCGTCIFLLCKVFLYTGAKNDNKAFAYTVLIVSFVLTWVEVWLLDFQVLPREKKETAKAAAQLHGQVDDRAPLLNGRCDADRFVTPIDSPAGSDDEGEKDRFRSLPGSRGHSRSGSHGSLNLSLGSQEKEYQRQAREAFDTTWRLFQSDNSEWKIEGGRDLDTGIVFSKHFPKIGKIFKLTAIMDISHMDLFDDMVHNIDLTPEWNSAVLESRIIQGIDDHTDVQYSIAAEAAGGLVSSRDFVNLRHWDSRGGVLIASACATQHPDMPATKKHIRGENRPGGWIYEPVPGEPNKCLFTWLLNTDLKGWLPQYLIDQTLSSVLFTYLKGLRKRSEQIKAYNHV